MINQSKRTGGRAMLDGEIIDLYLKREPDAIRRTSEKYGSRLLALSNRLLQDMETAKECENDTYLQAWERIPPNEPREYFFAFLAKIIRHLSLDVCRKKNRQKRNAVIVELSGELEQCIPDRSSNVQTAVDGNEFGRVVSEFLRSLPAQQRNMFVRRYWYADSVAQIAEEFACPENTVKSILFRVRGKMKRFLEKEGYDV